MGALPWLRGEALQDQVRRAPSSNNVTECKGECHYVQRPAEHPFLKRLVPSLEVRKEAEAALLRGARLPSAVARILDENQWSWAITGSASPNP